MKYFEGIIVVEGKSDASYLSSFIDSEYVVLNGYELNNFVIDYLTHIKENRKILLLVDPDDAGETITQKFLSKNIKADVIKIDYKKCNKNNKHGVAECDMNEILEKLKNYLSDSKKNKSDIKSSQLENLGIISSKEKRDIIIDKFHLGRCNTKTFLKRLNYNDISYDSIEKALNN